MATTYAKEQQRLMLAELRQMIADGKEWMDVMNCASRCLVAGCRRTVVQKILDDADDREAIQPGDYRYFQPKD